ncbi:MAG: hypothetical protein GXO60_07145 [Epsilonproteobacteria bacterium]|nr:hypothetical protein [Campylobacterota bacterium]
MDYEEFLKNKYNKVTLTKEELSEELNLSVRFITDKVRECSADIPRFILSGRTPLFPINEVAKFLKSRLIQVALS